MIQIDANHSAFCNVLVSSTKNGLSLAEPVCFALRNVFLFVFWFEGGDLAAEVLAVGGVVLFEQCLNYRLAVLSSMLWLEMVFFDAFFFSFRW